MYLRTPSQGEVPRDQTYPSTGHTGHATAVSTVAARADQEKHRDLVVKLVRGQYE